MDAAQAAPHHAIDVQQLDCDFLAFSSHKMCGPTSVGALWGRAELLEAMAPFNLGGHMIRSVWLEETTWGQIPYKFEAGTQPIAEAVGFGAAVDYVTDVGIVAIEEHERELTTMRSSAWPRSPASSATGRRRSGARDRLVQPRGIHPHDVAQILDMDGVAIRAGHHCCQPLMTRLGVAATNRASFYLYTIPEEIDRLVEGLHKAHKLLG